MNMLNKIKLLSFFLLALSVTACNDDDEAVPQNNDMYSQEDQMGRPAINTVFVTTPDKDAFNRTIPSQQGMAFGTKFSDRLLALNAGYTTNALGLDAAGFTGILATDVLSVAMNGTTTFFDGTNVLTGRQLSDDVISTELLLIFGGPMGADNPGLSDDHVDANDKAFLTTFPYLANPH